MKKKPTPNSAIVCLIIIISLGFFVFPAFAAKPKTVHLIASGRTSNGGSSAELILLMEILSVFSKDQVKVIGPEIGTAYRYQGNYIITNNNQSFERASVVALLKTGKNLNKTLIIESERTVLIIPSHAPKSFLQLLDQVIENPKITIKRFQGFLKSIKSSKKDSAQEGYLYLNPKEPNLYFSFPGSQWKTDLNWDVTFYIRYKVLTEGQEFYVYAVPKAYGDYYRATHEMAALKKKEPDSIILNTGNSLPIDPPDEAPNALKLMHESGTKYYAIGISEISNMKKVIEPYLKENQKSPHIEFLSANLFDLSEAKPNEWTENCFYWRNRSACSNRH